MPSPYSFFSRFLSTFGLLSLLLIVLSTAAYKPLKDHIVQTQQMTAWTAKSRVLGYQTPDFKQLAKNLFNDHVFKPREVNDHRAGTNYVSFYKKGVELFPELFEMYYMQGICYFWMNDLPLAEASLQQSLKLNPGFFWSYYNLGLLYLKTGQIDAAVLLFTAAKNIPPEITKKTIYDLQAFNIIWRYMSEPENYINRRLHEADLQINYFLLVALAVKNHQNAVHFDPNQWDPVFF
jgi:tetratricopeptide (TPR) repeat protein